jgi:DNA ligase-1
MGECKYMDKVIEIFKQIQETSGKNDKQFIIADNKNNEIFKKCLIFLLDSNTITGISKAKIGKKLAITDYIVIDKMSFSELMDYIKDNNTGKDCDLLIVQSFINNQPNEYREFYQQMVTKSLKLGVDTTTVNKAIPNLIATWEVQLGSGYDKLKLKKDEWFSLSQKLNGNRCSFHEGKLISRQGKEFRGFQHIIDDILACDLQHWFIDGELIGKNELALTDGENFRRSTGIINSDNENKQEIKLVIFDMFPAEQLKNKESNCEYRLRYESNLIQLKNKIESKKIKNIEIVKVLYQGTDQLMIEEYLQHAVDNDWEGIMLNKNTTYKCKRTTDLIKIKRFYTMDLPIADVAEGDGRLKGTLGALIVDFKGNKVNIGSGYSDDQRDYMWENKADLIGRIAEVKYKEISSDKKTGLESLQFPIFVSIRELGKGVSYD